MLANVRTAILNPVYSSQCRGTGFFYAQHHGLELEIRNKYLSFCGTAVDQSESTYQPSYSYGQKAILFIDSYKYILTKVKFYI